MTTLQAAALAVAVVGWLVGAGAFLAAFRALRGWARATGKSTWQLTRSYGSDPGSSSAWHPSGPGVAFWTDVFSGASLESTQAEPARRSFRRSAEVFLGGLGMFVAGRPALFFLGQPD